MGKRFLVISLIVIMSLIALVAVFTTDLNSKDLITVVSREDGSGTRGAFVELLGIEVTNDAGEKVDMTTVEAIIANSTNLVMISVAGDINGIGYISFGSLNDTIKAVNVDGVKASAENFQSGEYKIHRAFNVAYKGELSPVARDFLNYILSAEGQAVVEETGYIKVTPEAEVYTATTNEGKVVVSGSSSVTPVMEKLKEAYNAINPNVEIEVQMSDSTTGMASTIDGIADLGMASRDLKESELAQLTPVVIAIDGLAIVINNDNPVEELTQEQIRRIFVGEVTTWAEVTKE